MFVQIHSLHWYTFSTNTYQLASPVEFRKKSGSLRTYSLLEIHSLRLYVLIQIYLLYSSILVLILFNSLRSLCFEKNWLASLIRFVRNKIALLVYFCTNPLSLRSSILVLILINSLRSLSLEKILVLLLSCIFPFRSWPIL